jgi:hypothetical protein
MSLYICVRLLVEYLTAKYIGTYVLSLLVASLKLEVPPEPSSVRESIRRGLEAHRRLEIMSLKQGTWIASPLWRDYGWGLELKRHGVTWQKFMIIIRDHYPYFLDWVNGKAPWGYVIGKLIERVEEEAKLSEGSER